jgi:UDP-glucose 6-dehydrogenase
MSIESAELTKIFYNTQISTRIAQVNAAMEVANKIPGCNIDDVTSALKHATKRIVSSAYMNGGMGDGGSCVEGDTPVLTSRGLIPIKDLVGNEEVEVIVQDSKQLGSTKAVKAKNIRKTGERKSLIRVRFNNGKWVDCTCDHQFGLSYFFTHEFNRIEAKDLRPGMSVWAIQWAKTVDILIQAVESLPGQHDVYCMEVPDVGWFCANGVMVSNCHPRDNIAMSFLARKLNLSHDIFYDAMKSREDQTKWFCDIIQEQMSKYPTLPLIILGKSFKSETNITTGSPSLLLQNILRERGVLFDAWDPYVDKDQRWLNFMQGSGGLEANPSYLFFIATKHQCFADWKFTSGSVIVDPHRYIPQRPNITVIPIGIGAKV